MGKRSPTLAVTTIQSRILALRAHRIQCPILPRGASKTDAQSRSLIARSAVDRWLKENATSPNTPTRVRLRVMWRLLEERPKAPDFRPQDRVNAPIRGRSREDQYRLLYYACLAIGNDVYLGGWIRTHRRFHLSEGSVQCDVPLPLLMEPRATCRHREDDSTAATVLGAQGGQHRVCPTPVDQAESKSFGHRLAGQHHESAAQTDELPPHKIRRVRGDIEGKVCATHGSLNLPRVSIVLGDRLKSAVSTTRVIVSPYISASLTSHEGAST